MPWLQSPDMQPVGGGYDSTDPRVIEQHVRWMEYMHADAATIDLTNNVGCIFSSGPVSPEFCDPATPMFRAQNRTIRDNVGNLYPAWTKLGTSLKLIPLLGCQTNRDLVKGTDGKSGFQKEVEYFGHLMARYPNLDVRYLGRPLMLVYIGTPVNLNILERAKGVLRASGLDKQYTFRIVAGYLDSQPSFWNNPNQQPDGPIQIAPRYGFWSVVDRLKPSYHLFPTYSLVPEGSVAVENLTVSLATAGQSGWGCGHPVYCPEDALRYGHGSDVYPTLESFMAIADQLKPRFLIVDQFNEFVKPDEGWNADTSDDAEPTQKPHGWGFSALEALRDDIALFHATVY